VSLSSERELGRRREGGWRYLREQHLPDRYLNLRSGEESVIEQIQPAALAIDRFVEQSHLGLADVLSARGDRDVL
jgi:Holliday junction resolvasome RuvABC endonuclease subunit